MLIEYKIKFEKDGLTVSQRIEPSSTSPQVANGRVKALSAPAGAASKNPLAELSSGPNPPSDDSSGPNPPSDDSSGPNPPSDDSSGPTPANQSPIFVLGPFVFNNPAPASTTQPEQPNGQKPKAYRARATS